VLPGILASNCITNFGTANNYNLIIVLLEAHPKEVGEGKKNLELEIIQVLQKQGKNKKL